MKKILILAALLTLAACAQEKGPKYLVLYYSQTMKWTRSTGGSISATVTPFSAP